MSAAKPVSQATRVRWMIILMLMGFAFLGHFNRISIAVAGTERFTKDGGLTNSQMGWVYWAFLFVYTLGMLPGGWLIDRLGARIALAGMAIGMGSCVALTGGLGLMGLPIAGIFVPLIVIRSVAGFCSVPLHPGAAHSVASWMPLQSRVTANGIVTAGALVGVALAYPGFGWLMDRLEWPIAFVCCGAFMVFYAFVWLGVSAESPDKHSWCNSSERDLVKSKLSPVAISNSLKEDIGRLFRNQSFLLLSISYAAIGYFQYLFFYWVETYFQKVLNLPVTTSRNAAFSVTFAMAIGMGFGGFLSDALCNRFGRRRGCQMTAMVGMGLGMLFGWLGVVAASPQMAVVWFSLAMGSIGTCEGIFWTTVPILERQRSGLACAFLNTVGNGIGQIAPILTPLVAKHFGWHAAIQVACVVCGVGAALWIWINPEEPAEEAATQDRLILIPGETT